MLKLRESSLNWALENIKKHNDTYVFPQPFEFEAIEANWDEIRNHLKALNVYSSGVRPYRTAVTPKSKLGFRISTQLDPLDSIIYNAIIFEIHKDIENARLPKERDVAFSFRLNPDADGNLYDKDYNWDKYKEKEKKLTALSHHNFIIATDIADFFPSIYLHNIETVLRECVKKSGHATHAETLINIIKAMHLNQTHKGLPVGPQFSRPIAELILDGIDRVLLDNKFVFIRYVDDYRIFCTSESEAYEKLAFLAQKLYDILNLKLNEQKTEILPRDVFRDRYLQTPEDKEEESILDKFNNLLDEIGISRNPYEEIDMDSLDEEQEEKLKEVNIVNLLFDELQKDNVDFGFFRFLLNNLARFDNSDVAELILEEEHMRKLFPVLRAVVRYLERLRSLDKAQRQTVGKAILDLLQNSFVGQLPFNRAWMLSLFTKDDEWDNQDEFVSLLKKYNDNEMTTRKLYLALGRSQNIRFFREHKQLKMPLDAWARRAFIAAISCLPEDERKPWFKTRALTQRDFLDQMVEKWALQNHF